MSERASEKVVTSAAVHKRLRADSCNNPGLISDGIAIEEPIKRPKTAIEQEIEEAEEYERRKETEQRRDTAVPSHSNLCQSFFLWRARHNAGAQQLKLLSRDPQLQNKTPGVSVSDKSPSCLNFGPYV